MRERFRYFNRQWLRPATADDGAESSYSFEVSEYGGQISLRDCNRGMTWGFWSDNKQQAKAHVKAMSKFAQDLDTFIEQYMKAHIE